MATTRRSFLRRGALGAGGAALAFPALAGAQTAVGPFGPVQEDPFGLLDLPDGFRYTVVQSIEDTLTNGAPVPGDFDAMVALPWGRGGRQTLLVRNHELSGERDAATKAVVEGRNPYAATGIGGTTAVLVGADGTAAGSYVTSSGTIQNCAGGGTPWGTWLTCEETRDPGHGFVFEVDPRDPENDLSKTPITGMGFFSHEAVDIDPRTGIAYLTEDDFQNEIPDDVVGEGPESRVSFLYRFIPTDPSGRPGALQAGGRLQVMTLDFLPSFNVDLAYENDRFGVVWRDVDPADPRPQAIEFGAARFQRLEGCHFAGGAFWFDDTAGGEKRNGQLFRLIPSGDPTGGGRDLLELFFEAESTEEGDSPDNLTISPWGDLWFAEDGDGIQRIMGVTPEGRSYEFARNRLIGLDLSDGTSAEFCGPTFSPDGQTFFVNVQNPGHTFAITGPFPSRNPGRQRELATATPKGYGAPRVSGALREEARRLGMSPYEAKAYRRLGVDLRDLR